MALRDDMRLGAVGGGGGGADNTPAAVAAEGEAAPEAESLLPALPMPPGSPAGDLPTLMTLYLREVRRFDRLSPEQEQQLQKELACGSDDARRAMICHHLGLVIAIARHFGNRGLELLDLIEEGNLGMLVALQKFDVQRGLRFSTYAGWWIRYYLQTAVATQVPIVRPPLRAQQRAGRQAWQHWCESHGATAASLPAEGGEFTNGACDPVPLGPLVTTVPLHADEHEARLVEAGLHHRDVADEVAEGRDTPRLSALLRELVARLPPRQRDIVVARFGLDGRDECTLQQLSEERGVTRERIRQVQADALQSLRAALEGMGITRDIALA
jgi:RNA polymerase sigma factor (sigma-70 family)